MKTNKPDHFNLVNASRFQLQSIVDNYKYRIQYSDEIFKKMSSILKDPAKNVLDVGTGTGEIAKKISKYVDHVDAIDIH